MMRLMLVDRGELDLDSTIARDWPEFAANGEERIKVRHLLSHTSGVSGWEQPITLDGLYHLNKSTALMAAQAPWGFADTHLPRGLVGGSVPRWICGCLNF
jgi:CubicO group peptidase (beta-lactamase class C family)